VTPQGLARERPDDWHQRGLRTSIDQRVDATPPSRLHVDDRGHGPYQKRQDDHETELESRVDEEEREGKDAERQHGVEEEEPDDVPGAEAVPAS